MCMCNELNKKWPRFALPEKFTMSDKTCQKCNDELVYCEDCAPRPRAEKNTDALVAHAKAERIKQANKNWERFLAAFRHIGCSTFGSIDACGLTMDQVDTATAMFTALGYVIERHFLTSKDDRMVYWVFLYYTKTKD